MGQPRRRTSIQETGIVLDRHIPHAFNRLCNRRIALSRIDYLLYHKVGIMDKTI